MKRQMTLFEHAGQKQWRARTIHGGGAHKGKRKLERPLSLKRPIHLVLRATRAKGTWSFLASAHKEWIHRLLRKKARKFGVTLADYANVGNHLHLKVKIHNREGFQNFLRSITSQIARKITGARRGVVKGAFWDGLAFTRVLKSYREELYLRGYIMANYLEAGQGYAVREKFRQKFGAWMAGRALP